MDTCTLGASVNDSEFSGDIRAKIGDPIQFYGSLSNSYSSVTKRFAVVLIGSNQYSLEADPALNFRDIASQLWTKHSQPQTFAYRKVGVLADMQPGSYGIRLMTPYPDSRTICVLPYKLVIVPPAS
jgi:hypothetical protein